MHAIRMALVLQVLFATVAHAQPTYFPVARGAHPHDVAASRDAAGPVYYTAQATGKLGILDPATGKVDEIPLGKNSAPHGVVVGPDGAPWITDGGQNAILRVDPQSRAIKRWNLPASAANANLNTLTFDRRGRAWFTGQSGYYGRVDPASNDINVWRAPGQRSVWHHDHTVGRRLLRVARRQPHRPHRHRDRRGDGHRSRRRATRGPGVSGQTPRATCGSATGIRGRSAATIRRPRRGASGSSPATRRLIRSGSIPTITYG